MLRLLLKTIFGIIIIALAIYGGIYAWFQLKTAEDIHNTDIFEAIPANSNTILVVHNPKQLSEVWKVIDKFSALLPETKSLAVVDAIGKSQICSEQCIDKESLVISYYPEGALLFLRMKKTDFEYMEKKFFAPNLSGFAPKKEIYNETEIFIKATNDESFFCYTLYNNIFIGSFEKRLIYKAIDTYDNKTGLRNDSVLKKPMTLFDKFDKNALAGLYIDSLKNSTVFNDLITDSLNNWLIGDIRIKDQTLEISGFLPASNITTNKSDTLHIDMDFDTKMIPLSCSYFKYHLVERNTDNYTDKIKTLMKDSVLFGCVQNSIGFIKFAGNDSLQSDREIIAFKSSCVDKSRKENGHTIVPHEDYLIVSNDKESAEDYLMQLKDGCTFMKNQLFQTIFDQHYDKKDIHEITWMQKDFSQKDKIRYGFLMFISPNYPDKFYSLTIVQEP